VQFLAATSVAATVAIGIGFSQDLVPGSVGLASRNWLGARLSVITGSISDGPLLPGRAPACEHLPGGPRREGWPDGVEVPPGRAKVDEWFTGLRVVDRDAIAEERERRPPGLGPVEPGCKRLGGAVLAEQVDGRTESRATGAEILDVCRKAAEKKDSPGTGVSVKY
jgi:hypothetical protein